MGAPRKAGPFLAGLLVVGSVVTSAVGADLKTPPPTPVPPAGSPSPFVSHLSTPSPPSERPDVLAAAAVLADPDTGQVLYAKAATDRYPIASLTKLMAALLVLERTQPSDTVKVSKRVGRSSHRLGLSELGLVGGERIAVGELLYGLLLQSANDAAEALAERVSGTGKRFVAEMNRRARELGMADTLFRSPGGLDDRGYSSAADLFTLTRAALQQPFLAHVVSTRFHQVLSRSEPPRVVQNRNVLLWLYPGTFGVKTGFTAKAGYNVIAAARRGHRRLVVVVLGSAGEPFSDAAALLNYGFAGFERRTLVRAGESLGTVGIRGGRVPVEAGSSLELLLPKGSEGRVTRSLEPDPMAAFPPMAGDVVGQIRIRVGKRPPASAPVVVSSVPPPPLPPSAGPWWRRAAGTIAAAVGELVHALLS